jgi:TM2 domain-containing membrane protein YozV
MNEAAVMQQMTDAQRATFIYQMTAARKNPTTATMLALFLGGLGAHKFYLGKTGFGLLYALFCWTLIPSILGVIEAFTMKGEVERYNEARAREIAASLGIS